MTIPEEMLAVYLDKLKEKFDTQKQEESIQHKLKVNELASIESSLEELLDLCISKVITRDKYLEKKAELERCKVTISSGQSNRQFRIFGTLEHKFLKTKQQNFTKKPVLYRTGFFIC